VFPAKPGIFGKPREYREKRRVKKVYLFDEGAAYTSSIVL
jgi:hypothetical protein